MKVMHYLTMAVLISAAGAMVTPVYAEGGHNNSGTHMNNRANTNTNTQHDSRYNKTDPRTQGSANQNRGSSINSDQPNTYNRMQTYDDRNNDTRYRNTRNTGNTTTRGGTNQQAR